MPLPSIPVHLINPGQVFACLGLLEAADILFGDARGRFEGEAGPWANFVLEAEGAPDPFRGVLEALSTARIQVGAPPAALWEDPADGVEAGRDASAGPTFPAARPERMALPLRVEVTAAGRDRSLGLGHWAEGDTGRDNFKLYSGNRSGQQIAEAMLHGVRDKAGRVKTAGLQTLWLRDAAALREDPFGMVVPMGGSFNLDPRGGWTALDAGYSPNRVSHAVASSPVVEILAALGLEHARPRLRRSEVRYGVWADPLGPTLARPALGAVDAGVALRIFGFTLALSGKNRVVTFAEEEMGS